MQTNLEVSLENGATTIQKKHTNGIEKTADTYDTMIDSQGEW